MSGRIKDRYGNCEAHSFEIRRAVVLETALI